MPLDDRQIATLNSYVQQEIYSQEGTAEEVSATVNYMCRLYSRADTSGLQYSQRILNDLALSIGNAYWNPSIAVGRLILNREGSRIDGHVALSEIDINVARQTILQAMYTAKNAIDSGQVRISPPEPAIPLQEARQQHQMRVEQMLQDAELIRQREEQKEDDVEPPPPLSPPLDELADNYSENVGEILARFDALLSQPNPWDYESSDDASDVLTDELEVPPRLRGPGPRVGYEYEDEDEKEENELNRPLHSYNPARYQDNQQPSNLRLQQLRHDIAIWQQEVSAIANRIAEVRAISEDLDRRISQLEHSSATTRLLRFATDPNRRRMIPSRPGPSSRALSSRPGGANNNSRASSLPNSDISGRPRWRP